jgi:Flp pilus assembly pilin Flp
MRANNLNKVSRFSIRQTGQGMSEYIIIVALIAVGAIGVFTAFGGTIRNQVAAMALELSGQTGTTQVTAAKTAATAAGTSAAKVTNMGTYAGQTAP